MANICHYNIKVVGKTKESVARVREILKYNDPEFCLYKVYEAEFSEEPHEVGDGLWECEINGENGWSCYNWINHDIEPEYGSYGKKLILEYKKDANGNPDFSKPVYGTATFKTFVEICPALDVGIEIYAEEYEGCYFQEHELVNARGIVVDSSKAACEPEWLFESDPDNDGHPRPDGFGNAYCDFKAPKEIYGEDL